MKQEKLLIVIVLILSGFFVQAQQVEIKVDATKSIGVLDPFWASQIIHPTEFLLTSWGKELLNTMTENGAELQYVRIYNQPENAIRISANGKISYDWGQFDEMAEIILGTGNNLKIVFFGMPSELAAYPESVKKRPYGGLVHFATKRLQSVREAMCRLYPPCNRKIWFNPG